MKVLACAYACNPLLGSEEGVGWGWISAIARNHDVWVLTDAVHRRDIEEHVASEPERYRNIQFVYIPRVRWMTLERIWPPAYLATYRIWQRAAFNAARDLHDKVGFDLVHVITFVSFRVPGPFFSLGAPLYGGQSVGWKIRRGGSRGLVRTAPFIMPPATSSTRCKNASCLSRNRLFMLREGE